LKDEKLPGTPAFGAVSGTSQPAVGVFPGLASEAEEKLRRLAGSTGTQHGKSVEDTDRYERPLHRLTGQPGGRQIGSIRLDDEDSPVRRPRHGDGLAEKPRVNNGTRKIRQCLALDHKPVLHPIIAAGEPAHVQNNARQIPRRVDHPARQFPVVGHDVDAGVGGIGINSHLSVIEILHLKATPEYPAAPAEISCGHAGREFPGGVGSEIRCRCEGRKSHSWKKCRGIPGYVSALKSPRIFKTWRCNRLKERIIMKTDALDEFDFKTPRERAELEELWRSGLLEERRRRVMSFVARHRDEIIRMAGGDWDASAVIQTVARMIHDLQSIDMVAEAREQICEMKREISDRCGKPNCKPEEIARHWAEVRAADFRRRVIRQYLFIVERCTAEIVECLTASEADERTVLIPAAAEG